MADEKPEAAPVTRGDVLLMLHVLGESGRVVPELAAIGGIASALEDAFRELWKVPAEKAHG
jgi:hypothetical protein